MDARVIIIVAVAENGVIGQGDKLPWNLPTDLRQFQDLTRGHTVIVGRKTHESIMKKLGHPLRDLVTIVLSRDPNYTAQGCIVVHSWQEAMGHTAEDEPVFVIGGAEIYQMALPHAHRMHLTRVHANPPGDVFFPEVDWENWSLVWQPERVLRDGRNDHDFTLEVWERRI
jgi:dihydrofolate reductase